MSVVLNSDNASLTFVEQFYYPDGWGGTQIPRDITMDLARAGWRVEVVCGSEPYAPVVGDPQPDPSVCGVRIRRVPRLLSGDIHSHKLVRQCWFYAVCAPFLLFSRARIFVAQTNPPMIVPLTAAVSWLRRRPMVIIAQDLYPEVVFAHKMLDPGSFLGRSLRTLFRWSYRRARRVVCLGPHMRSRLIAKGVAPRALVEISNWATGDERIIRGPDNRLREEWGLTGKFVVLYSGNLGIAHDIETPIAAVAKALPMIPNLALVFVGKGSRIAQARELVAAEGIEQAVQFRSFVPSEMLPHSLGLADLALVTLREGFEGLVVPSKLFGHLARGVPTLYVGPDSDIQHFISESGGGVCVANGDVQRLVSLLCGLATSREALDQMTRAAQTYYQKHLSRDAGLMRYRAVMQGLLRSDTSIRDD